jgi:uncharacterized RDD family membrane protein YckC
VSDATAARRRKVEVPAAARDFQGHRAGIITRCLAAGVDFAVVLAVLGATWVGWAAVKFLLNPQGFSWPSPPIAFVFAEGYVVAVLYLTVAWATSGRSFGGQLLGLRVVNFRGRRMTWPGAFLRSAFCVALPIGLAWILVSPRNRSVQDVVLQTSVVYDWSHAGVSADDVTTGATDRR